MKGILPLRRFFFAILFLLFAGMSCETSAQNKNTDLFGRQEKSETALIGTFYDLKQTQKRTPPERWRDFSEIVDEFLAKGWDETVLNRYFRAAQALYTTQIFVPRMSAAAAPKAYNVEKVVRPSAWVAHYKGQVAAPADGVYRFVGGADDLLAVALNGKTVLYYGLWKSKRPGEIWEREDKAFTMRGGGWPLIAGNWFKVNAGEVMDLDILIGERPGGEFEAFLLLQKQGVDYPLDNNKKPLLPIFQLAPYDTPVGGIAPRFSRGGEIWKGIQ